MSLLRFAEGTFLDFEVLSTKLISLSVISGFSRADLNLASRGIHDTENSD